MKHQPLTAAHVASRRLRSVPPLPMEHMAKHDPDAVYDRFSGPQRHVRIDPPVNFIDPFAKLVIVAGGCFVVGLWTVL